MDDALIALTDRGVRFTFLGEPFRSRQAIPNEDIVEINFSQAEITDADVEAILPLILARKPCRLAFVARKCL
jgi:hypothetical protein